MIVVTAAQVAAAARVGLSVTLTGVDGSVWDLSGGGSGVKLRAGVAGIGSPDPERWWLDSPAVDGSFHLGYRIPRGQVTLPVLVRSDSSLGMRNVDAAFKRAIDPSGVCYLSMRASDAAPRTVAMRLTSGLASPFEMDPLFAGNAQYTLEFATEVPYWVGDTQTATWTGPSQIPISVTTGKPVTNPGDVPSWPTWTIGGPWVTSWVGPDQSSLVKLTPPARVDTGFGRIVETDPRTSNVRVRDLTGADKWVDVTSRVFAPIPAGDTTVRILATSTASQSSVSLSFPALYRQPW